MELAALRRAFRARPGTSLCTEFATFLAGLGTNETAWQSLVWTLEKDVVPVVLRYHASAESDEISSICLAGAFESWIPEWVGHVKAVARVRTLLAEERHDEAFDELEKHRRFRGARAREASTLWNRGCHHDALRLVEGTHSARSHFIARTRAQISESQRKQKRQSRLMRRHCNDSLGIPSDGASSVGTTTPAARAACGAELDRTSSEHDIWLVSALPPAHVPSQELTDRLRRMLGAIDELGPEHSRVFNLLLEGLSQRSIARVEGRHPAAISRRVRHLQELCRVQLLE
jgi:hypothetical protein